MAGGRSVALRTCETSSCDAWNWSGKSSWVFSTLRNSVGLHHTPFPVLWRWLFSNLNWDSTVSQQWYVHCCFFRSRYEYAEAFMNTSFSWPLEADFDHSKNDFAVARWKSVLTKHVRLGDAYYSRIIKWLVLFAILSSSTMPFYASDCHNNDAQQVMTQ